MMRLMSQVELQEARPEEAVEPEVQGMSGTNTTTSLPSKKDKRQKKED
jgi:hypothetical protein